VTVALIDTAGGESSTTAAAIAASDLCLIPARPSPADIEAAAPTLSAVRRLDKPFAFILNQTPARSPRLDHAATALGEAAVPRDGISFNEISLNAMGVLARPFIVLRNDQQDALGAGLAVTEYALEGKSAEEIRSLWQWVWIKLTGGAPAYTPGQEQVHAGSEHMIALG
jgi:chromosome partitioning protein